MHEQVAFVHTIVYCGNPRWYWLMLFGHRLRNMPCLWLFAETNSGVEVRSKSSDRHMKLYATWRESAMFTSKTEVRFEVIMSSVLSPVKGILIRAKLCRPSWDNWRNHHCNRTWDVSWVEIDLPNMVPCVLFLARSNIARTRLTVLCKC